MNTASAVIAVVFSVLAALLSSGAAAEQPTATSAARPTTPPSSALTAAVTVAEAHTTVLPEMTVTASPVDDTSYNVPNATTATRTDTPIFDTPVSVQVVPKQVLKDQQVIALKDALKNVSGVQRSASAGNLYDGFIIRGFENDANIYRNGLRSCCFRYETANLEQIEVLKGPAAVLYGRIEPGGLVNLVTKRPLEQPYYALEQQFGSYDLYRTVAEATGPITSDGSLLYRFDLAYKSNNSFLDFVDLERVFVSPSLTWRLSERTEINLNVEYQDDTMQDESGIPAIGTRPAPVPINRYLQDDVAVDETDRVLVELSWSHRFSEHWALRNRFQANLTDYNQTILTPAGFLDDRTLDRGLWDVGATRDYYATNLDLTGHVETYGIAHDLLAGVDYWRYNEDFLGFCCNPPEAAVPPIDIFSPTYGIVDLSFRTSATDNFVFKSAEEWYGVYFQDQLKFFDGQVQVLGGGRYDWAKYGTLCCNISLADNDVDNTISEESFSPRVGVVYHPWQWLSLYGNYVESFGTNNGRSATGDRFDPEGATQYEVGLKTELWEGRLSSTLAFYHLTKENILTADITTLDRFDSIAIGEARSQGIELDLSGQLADSLSLIASYAYTDTRITRDDHGNEGHRLPNVPDHSGSAWLKYELLESPVRGLSLGTGVFLASQREGDNENSFELPGYVRWDAMAAYRFNVGKSRLTAQVNVNNILDKEYFEHSDIFNGIPRFNIFPAEPLTVLGSIRVEF